MRLEKLEQRVASLKQQIADTTSSLAQIEAQPDLSMQSMKLQMTAMQELLALIRDEREQRIADRVSDLVDKGLESAREEIAREKQTAVSLGYDLERSRQATLNALEEASKAREVITVIPPVGDVEVIPHVGGDGLIHRFTLKAAGREDVALEVQRDSLRKFRKLIKKGQS